MPKGSTRPSLAKRCNYVYFGHEGACRDQIDGKTGVLIKARKKPGDKCNAIACKGKEKCVDHGGRNLGAPITNGMYSKALRVKAPKLAAAFEEAMADPGLLKLEEEAAIFKALIAETIERVGEFGESAELWQAACKWYAALRSLDHVEQALEWGEAFEALGTILQNGLGMEKARAELLTLAEQRRKLIDTENKARQLAETTLTEKEVVILATQIITVIGLHVEDEATVERISQDIVGLIAGNGRPGPQDQEGPLSLAASYGSPD